MSDEQQEKPRFKGKRSQRNVYCIDGNLVEDPGELRTTASGISVLNVRIACSVYNAESVFLSCTIWGRMAEVVKEHAKKGKLLHLTGNLRADTWKDEATGKNRTKLFLNVTEMDFASDPYEEPRAVSPDAPRYQTTGNPEDDIPF